MGSVRRSVAALPALVAILAWALPASAQTLTRGPYLQQGNQSSIVVRWRTSTATNSRVRIGTTFVNPLPTIIDDTASTTEHIVTLTGLNPDTQYFYSAGSTSITLAGPDTNHFFVTSPIPGTAKPTRIWVLGDSGTGSTNQTAVRDAYTSFTGTRHTDLWLMLGDNVYSTGTDAEYQSRLFNIYPAMLRKSVLWPTIGNHESSSADGITQTGPHYANFTLPTNAEAGGLASGTEAYYSFDYGNIHFICLESHDIIANTTAKNAMKTWLQNDLAATARDWVIAFWHHPPYTKGSHNSDTESGLITMRTEFNPILESAGVDLLMAGHSHSYERSYLIDGHYGSSGSFTNAMKKDGGSGRDPTPYQKSAGTLANEGAVYVVAGSSGQISGGSLNHPAMWSSFNANPNFGGAYTNIGQSYNVLGSVVIDVDGSRMDVRFLSRNGTLDDVFTITKGGTPPPSLPQVTISVADGTAGEPGPDPGSFTVTRTGDTSATLQVNFSVTGTATNGSDYQTISSPITIPAGQTSALLAITPIDDSFVESSENVTVSLASGSGYTVGSPSSATLAIQDDDGGGSSTTVSFQDGAAPTAAYAGTRDTFISETNPATNYGTSTVCQLDGVDVAPGTDVTTLIRWDLSSIPSGSVIQALTLTVNVTNASSGSYEIYEVKRNWSETQAAWNLYATGTAWQTAGAQGSLDRGSVLLGTVGPASVGSYTVTLGSAGLSLVQSWINSPSTNNGFLIGSTTTGDGLDFSSRETATAASRPVLTVTYTTPAAQPVVTISATDAGASEAGPNAGTFTVSRTGSTSSPLIVNLAVGGTAASGSDYASIGSAVTIPAAAASATITVTPVDDSTAEGNETVVASLSAGTGYTVGSAVTAQVMIADNDGTSDLDGDGLPDSWETAYWTDTTVENGTGDPDGDGLTNLQEFQQGTNPIQSDSDGDQMPDGWEALFGLFPTLNDASGDLDGDGYANLVEYQNGSNPSDPASVPGGGGGGGGGGSGGGCGCTGLEGLIFLGLLGIVVRRRVG